MDEERRRLHDEALREVDAVAAEFHALLPRERADAVGAVYARYSSRYQHSIADQVRGCLQAALQQGIFVPREHVFFDLAVRGAKQRRPGLDALKALLARRGVQALLVLTTNRLARKTYKALQFVEEEVVGRGIRGLFVKAGVDTHDEGRWRTLLNYHAGIDELVTSMYAGNIRVAQEGLFRTKLVFGTITFGYRARPVPGRPTRQKRERCAYEVDPDAAAWVRRVFHWYVADRLTLADLLRRLNTDPEAPLPPKATSGRWTRLALRLLLANPRYRGWWAYGKTKAVWQSAADYTRQVAREAPLAQQQFEELRIVDDATWYAAAQRLAAEDEKNRGRKSRDGDRKSRPRLLNGLFFCATHQRVLHVGGAFGKTVFCPECRDLPAASRPLFSLLNRELALRLTCARLAELVRADADLVAGIVAVCQREAAAVQAGDPGRPARLKAQSEKLSLRIQFVVDNLGDTEADQQESARLLRALRAERAQVDAERFALEQARDRPKAVPTEGEVLGSLGNLGGLLTTVAAGDIPEEAGPVRAIVELLTGGRIELEQMGERKAQRGWLRGRFRVRLLDVLAGKVLGTAPAGDEPGIEVTIDYRKSRDPEAWADRVKALYDRNLLIKAIAAELGIRPSLARKALDAWYDRAGEPRPDGRSRRAQLAVKHLEQPPFQSIADEVKHLMDGGLLLYEIAAQLGCDRNTVTAAKNYWYVSRGLQPPDGRSRRKDLDRKSGPPRD